MFEDNSYNNFKDDPLMIKQTPILSLLISGLFTVSAQAALLTGDAIDLRVHSTYGGATTAGGQSFSAVVGSGSEGSTRDCCRTLVFDLGEDNGDTTFNVSTRFEDTINNGYRYGSASATVRIYLTGLDFSAGEILTGFSFGTNTDGAVVESFSDTGITFAYADGPFAAGLGNTFLSGTFETTTVPVPAAAWLFGSALIGLAGIGRKRRA